MPYSLKFPTNICYKASQCTDVNDIETALAVLENYRKDCNQYNKMPGRSYYIRKRSLENKLKRVFLLSVAREQ